MCRSAVAHFVRLIAAIVFVDLSLDMVHELPAVLGLAEALQVIIRVRLVSIRADITAGH